MTRILLQYLLPLLGPLALYLLYMALSRRAAAKRGNSPPTIEQSKLFWSIVLGFVLMISSLVIAAITVGEKPGSGEYQAPRMENGKIVPPKFN